MIFEQPLMLLSVKGLLLYCFAAYNYFHFYWYEYSKTYRHKYSLNLDSNLRFLNSYLEAGRVYRVAFLQLEETLWVVV